jgi:hypothetical protein
MSEDEYFEGEHTHYRLVTICIILQNHAHDLIFHSSCAYEITYQRVT